MAGEPFLVGVSPVLDCAQRGAIQKRCDSTSDDRYSANALQAGTHYPPASIQTPENRHHRLEAASH